MRHHDNHGAWSEWSKETSFTTRPAPGQAVAYIYREGGPEAHTKANNFGSLLEENGVLTGIISTAEAQTFDYSSYNAILIGPDTGDPPYEWHGSKETVSAIDSSRKPIIGIGAGGISFFEQLNDLAIDWGDCWGTTKRSIYVMDRDHQIFHTPNEIAIPDDSIIRLYSLGQFQYAAYIPSPIPSDIVPLGRQDGDPDHYPLVQEKTKYLLWGFIADPSYMTEIGRNLFVNLVSFGCSLPKNQPPVADAGSDQSVSSGDLVYFDGSNSYDPGGSIVTYGWEFGDGEAAKGCQVSHRFRGAMDESKTYIVTLTVRDNEGTFSRDSINVTVVPLGKTVEVTRIPRTSPQTEAFAKMEVSYNWVDTRSGEDVYVVWRIRCSCSGFLGGYSLFILDTHSHLDPAVRWWDILSSETTEKTYVSPFTTFIDPSLSCLFKNWEPPSLVSDFYGEDFFKGFEVYGSDVMSIRATEWPEGYYFGTDPYVIMVELLATTFFEEDTAYFQPESAEVHIPIDINDLNLAHLCSPGELRVYDSQGRVTGLVNGEIREEIPNSAYKDGTVIILYSSDSHTYEVKGTDEGSYGLELVCIEGGETITFTATDIPISANATHEYTVDWDALSQDEEQDEEGVTVLVDSDGDGTFEQSVSTTHNELTHDEFMLQTATTVDFDPDTLNLRSKGKFVTAYIELPEGYDVEEIEVSSIKFNNTIPALLKPTQVGDYDSDGIPDLMVKFDRAVIEGILNTSDAVKITITGKVSGIDFKGSDSIRVISG